MVMCGQVQSGRVRSGMESKVGSGLVMYGEASRCKDFLARYGEVRSGEVGQGNAWI